ncbi:MAG: hypothetical protein QM706_01415 [Nitrospira sp.]
MARARAAEHQRPRSKTTPIEEVALGIAKLQEVLAAVNDLSQEGFPYRDAAQSKAELQFRECLRHAFGERSQEFQTYRNYKLRTADKAEVAQSLAAIQGLIHTLEDRKLELQGLKPTPKTEPSPETNAARLVLVPPTAATPTTLTDQPPSPIPVAAAAITDASPPPAPLIAAPHPPRPLSDSQTIAPAPPPVSAAVRTPDPPPAPTPVTAIPKAPETPVAAVSIPSPPPVPAAEQAPLTIDRAVEGTPPPAPVVVPPIPLSVQAQTHGTSPAPARYNLSTSAERPPTVVQAPPDPPSEKPAVGLSLSRVGESAPDQDPLNLIRKVCHRFHSVARQLRLRRDYRPTLEIDDDYDLQDLLCALLKVEFDEVATEEWTPPYTEGASRTTLLVNRDQIAVVAKKTRPGLTTKELADQVAADSAYYRAQGRCSTLFCFMYDPEGRIGSPKRLETTLTSVSEHCRVEVLVAPK